MADKKINIIFETQGLEETNKKLTSTANNVDSAFKKMNDSLKTTSESGQASGAKIAAGMAVASAAAAAVALAVMTVKDAIKQAAEEQTAINKLNNVLKVTGSYSEEVSQSFQDFADAIEKSSTFTNEQVLKQIALAKAMGYTNDQAKYLITTATKMATTFDMDLGSAAETLQGTLQGTLPRGIKKLNSELANMSQEALKAGGFFDWINKHGVDASSSLETYQGRMHQVGVALDDVSKAFGKLIVNSPIVLNGLKEIADTINQMSNANWISGLIDVDKIKGANNQLNALKNNLQVLLTEKEGFELKLFPDKDEMAKNEAAIIATTKRIAAISKEAAKEVAEANKPTPKGTPKSGLSGEDNTTIQSSKFSNEMYDQQLQLERDYADKLKQINDETNANSLESTQSAQMQQLEAEMIYNQQMMDIKLANDQEQAFLIENKYTREKTMLDNANKYLVENEKLKNKYTKDQEKLRQEQTKQSAESRKQILTSSLGQIAGLMSNSNMELFRIGQAAAIANATISTLEGAANALKLGPPLGPILSASIYAAGIANVAQIASTKPPKYEQGGIFDPTGTSISGDSNLARMNSREMILNMQQQSNLLNIATNGGGLSSNLLIDIKDAIIAQNYQVDIDGERLNNRLKDINSRRLK